jgi:hypothetical protein
MEALIAETDPKNDFPEAAKKPGSSSKDRKDDDDAWKAWKLLRPKPQSDSNQPVRHDNLGTL